MNNHRVFDAEILRCVNGCIDTFHGNLHIWDTKIAFEHGLHSQVEFPIEQSFAWQETEYFTVSAVGKAAVWIALLDKSAGDILADMLL